MSRSTKNFTTRSLSILAIVVGAMTATSLPAVALESPSIGTAHSVSDPGVVFSVLGDVGDGVGSRVTERELESLGLRIFTGGGTSLLLANQRATVTTTAATNNVLFRWNDFGGRQVVLRSLPYSKILSKHNLTYRTPRVVTQRASLRTPDGGTSWRYRLAANEVRCDFWGNNCKVVRTVTVRTIVDFRNYDSAGKYGVVTAYCEGISGKCPDFVKNALNQ